MINEINIGMNIAENSVQAYGRSKYQKEPSKR